VLYQMVLFPVNLSHGQWKVVNSEEAWRSEAQKAEAQGPKGRGGVGFLGKWGS